MKEARKSLKWRIPESTVITDKRAHRVDRYTITLPCYLVHENITLVDLARWSVSEGSTV